MPRPRGNAPCQAVRQRTATRLAAHIARSSTSCTLAHPAHERVAVTGRPVGDNKFWGQIPDSGSSISAGSMIAGLMARAAKLPGDSFRTATRKLNAFLSPVDDREAGRVLGDLDEGSGALLFQGLSATERGDVREDRAILPCGDALRFLSERSVRDFAPFSAGFHNWRGVRAAIRPFRQRSVFGRSGNEYTPLNPRDHISRTQRLSSTCLP